MGSCSSIHLGPKIEGYHSYDFDAPIAVDATIEEMQAAVEGLIARVIGEENANRFVPKVVASDRSDYFALMLGEGENSGKLIIEGNTGVSVASGFHYYLKEFAKSNISWCGERIVLPEIIELGSKARIEIKSLHQLRPYFNYCTFSYSASWWDWERWQWEIDYMAMCGINLPLAVVGLEAVWYETLLEFNFTDEEAREFISGPAFFAWQWMTNLEGACGPLPKSWIESHKILGKQIVDRQRSLGMSPMQQGFSGFVPKLLTQKYPDANIQKGFRWCNFPETYQLDPLDPLFSEMGKVFLQKQLDLFGTSHRYCVDPFHEGEPPVSGTVYLKKVGQEIWSLLEGFDPQAIWMMQSWSLQKAIMQQVPKGRLVVLDLAGYSTNFSGYPFVSGILHNFGNRINMHGDLANQARNPYAMRAKTIRSNAGFGLFMEGITQNPVFYDIAFSNIWNTKGQNLNDYLANYVERRYGDSKGKTLAAWEKLVEGPYRPLTDGVEKSSIFASRPAIFDAKSGPNDPLDLYYNPKLVEDAFKILLENVSEFGESEGFQFDVMDIGRQALTNRGQAVYKAIQKAWNSRDLEAFKKETQFFIALMKDCDRLLATREEYNFAKWYNDSQKWATNEEEAALYSLNASMLLTHWGPEPGEGEPHIFDYAWKEWAGLIEGYYVPRWQFFFDFLEKKLVAGESYNDAILPRVYDRPEMNSNEMYQEMSEMELKWIYDSKKEFTVSTEKTLEVAQELYLKYF